MRRAVAFILFDGETIAGCGGWSFRRPLLGGDASVIVRDAEALDPALHAARIRAMYANPDYIRRDVGRQILQSCEDAARSKGFANAEMMATLAGEPLYRACGQMRLGQPIEVRTDGPPVPLGQMSKSILPPRESDAEPTRCTAP